MWKREFVQLQLRFLLFFAVIFCGNSTSILELIVDGLPANVSIGNVPLFCSSSLAKEVPVPIARGTVLSLLVSHNNEFLEKNFGANQIKKIEYQKRFPVIQVHFIFQMASVCRGSAWKKNLESLLVNWECKTISHCNLIPLLEIIPKH